MKAFFASLKEEFKSKWKELTALILINLFELFIFSSVLLILPIWAIILICALIIGPAIALIVMRIAKDKVDKQDVKMLFLVIGLSILFGVVKSYLYMFSLLIAYLFYKDKKSMYKWMFIIGVGLLFIWIILALLQVLPDAVVIRYDEELESITHVRHTFGFHHPNVPLKFLLGIIVFGYMWIGDNKKYTIIYSILMTLVALWIGWLTNCRSGMITLIGFMVLMNVPLVVTWFKPRRLLFAFLILTFVVISFKGIPEVSNALSGRPKWFHNFLTQADGFMLVGKYHLYHFFANPSQNPFVYKPVDNELLFIIADGGLIALLTFTYFFFMAFEKNSDKKVTVAIIGMLVYGITEAFEAVYTYPLYIMMFIELIDLYFQRKDKIKLFKDKKKQIEAPSE